ncbi:GNAT family N-acetyltransferase [Glutamicibacter sp. PS]|uniref:GNAT family N-acetyltransferase n=1 Tax=Glutamicibacter sp. PS TaxID=3075634 RepID=UPI00283EF2AD|nr:GNAT family N-acetyltransferase [Glutamicibacter sp. PS]MDR4534555.1 GNAT family N-acetyltransferase [Glutamicibacter sp. PS]
MRLEIKAVGVDAPGMAEFIGEHLRDLEATAPDESRHAFDADRLTGPTVQLYAGYLGSKPVTMGALHFFADYMAEVKSMRTMDSHRGRGHARKMLQHLVEVATERGVRTLLLETGTHDHFRAARALYESVGFTPAPAFGSYRSDPHSAYYRLPLN